MTKKQLIKKLEKYDDDLCIVLASDSIGNLFSLLDQVDDSKNDYFDKITREFVDSKCNSEDKNCKKAIILWPV